MATAGAAIYGLVWGYGTIKEDIKTNQFLTPTAPTGQIDTAPARMTQDLMDTTGASKEMAQAVAQEWKKLSESTPGTGYVGFQVNNAPGANGPRVIEGSIFAGSTGNSEGMLCYETPDGKAQMFNRGNDGVFVPRNLLPTTAAQGCEKAVGESNIVSRVNLGAPKAGG